jgi:hypothetical protein
MAVDTHERAAANARGVPDSQHVQHIVSKAVLIDEYIQ